MTGPASPGHPAAERAADLRLARLHLRGGTYALARSELERLAGADLLDRDAVLDLAEVRWRTGDLQGASAAATAWLEDGEAAGAPLVLAHVIRAEAAADLGRADEAALHVDAAAAAGLGDRATLDAILAGIAARAAWAVPAGADELPSPDEPPAVPGPVTAPAAATAALVAAGAPVEPAPPGRAVPVTAAAAELLRAGSALVPDAPERAAVLLALAVRADRAAAEAVLGALDAVSAEPAHAAAFAFVRAEALRAAGRHEEARIAYASAERLALAPAEAGPPGSSQ
jgi:tetratricopeptide (TPR) repeat protein